MVMVLGKISAPESVISAQSAKSAESDLNTRASTTSFTLFSAYRVIVSSLASSVATFSLRSQLVMEKASKETPIEKRTG
jgi:hypothetical protein